MNSRRVFVSQLSVIVIALVTIRVLQSPLLAAVILPSPSCTIDPEQDLIGNTSEVLSVAFSPDGKHALTGSNDWTA